MISEKKVKLMTKVAIEEKNNHRNIDSAANSFKADYITINMVYVAITTTIGYVLAVALYALGNLEHLLVDISGTDFPKLIAQVSKYYFICLAVFLVIALIFYSIKYDKYLDKARHELGDLKTLTKLADK